MDDCLFKPIRLADLALALQGARHSENAGEPKQPRPLTELDLSALEQMAGDDHALMQRLREQVLCSLQDDLQRLDVARRPLNPSELRTLAHHIKGGAQMVGAARVVAACADLEQACRDAEIPVVERSVQVLCEAMLSLAQRLQT